MKIETKFNLGQKVYAIFSQNEFKPEQIVISGVQISIDFDKDGEGKTVVYKDQFHRYISESRCYVEKGDLIEHFKNNIKDL